MNPFRVSLCHGRRRGRHLSSRNSIPTRFIRQSKDELSFDPMKSRTGCFLSSSSSSTDQIRKEPKFRVLYKRNRERNTMPRAALGVSLFHTSYWTWYTLDFIPAVNASAIDSLHVDPTMGLVGVGLGLLVNSVALLYPMMTVSKVALSTTNHTIKVWMHDLPLVTASSRCTEYSVGQIFVNPTSAGGAKIVKKLNGDMSRFRGHLGVSVEGKKLPLLIDIQDSNEVKSSDLIFQALMNPTALERDNKLGRQPKRRRKRKASS